MLRGRKIFGWQIELQQRALYRGGLVVIVIDGEIAGQAEVARFAPQQARAEGMKRGDPNVRRALAAGAQEFVDAFFHHIGGFVGESNRENRVCRDAPFEQMGDAIGDHARFARSGAGKHQHRSFGSDYSFALAFVELIEQGFCFGRVRHGEILAERERLSNLPLSDKETAIALPEPLK